MLNQEQTHKAERKPYTDEDYDKFLSRHEAEKKIADAQGIPLPLPMPRSYFVSSQANS